MDFYAEVASAGLPVMNGADNLVPYALFAGVAGLIWGEDNIAPKTCPSVVQAASEGRWADAREIWRKLEPVMSRIRRSSDHRVISVISNRTGLLWASEARSLTRPAAKTSLTRNASRSHPRSLQTTAMLKSARSRGLPAF